MKFNVLLSIVLSFVPTLNYAQEFIYSGEFGSFKNASSFYINSSGHIYVTDSGSDEVYKLDTTGILLKSVGGFGWDNGSFDDPVDVFATSLTVYVCDKNNHRVQRFDKDLNFVEVLSSKGKENNDEQFGYPAGALTSGQGDLFILDTENKRIIKFDLFGNFIQNFGGFDYGEYSFTNPQSMAVYSSSALFVLNDNSLFVFDLFGNGISKTKFDFGLKNIRITFNDLTLSNDSTIYYSSLTSKELKLKELKLTDFNSSKKIISSIIFNNKLYVLTKDRILIFIR